MNTSEALEELGQLDKEKVRIEERQRSLEEKKDALASKMAELGVSPATLTKDISDLEESIQTRLDAARKVVKGIEEARSSRVEVNAGI